MHPHVPASTVRPLAHSAARALTLAVGVAAALLSLAPAFACASTTTTAANAGPLDVQVYDRSDGRILPLHRYRGEYYVAGEAGHEYELRLRNRGGGRVLAVTSVDGVNVVSGRTAATDQGGYVVDGWSGASIDGWRKSLGEVAAFYFTRLADSYAARTGRPRNVGVIGVAMFRERDIPPPPPTALTDLEDYRAASSPARESAARGGARADDAPQAAPAASANSATAQARSEAQAPARMQAKDRLGTGHGERHDSAARYVEFERASSEPDAVLRIYYDSRQNLVARGIIPRPRSTDGYGRPEPFPAAFVPDP
jgi:hypothetical protein